MAKELQRRVNISLRNVAIDVEDIFGIVTTHTVPLFGDACPTCGMSAAGGSPDIGASVAAILANVTEVETALAAKLKASGIDVPSLIQT